MGSRTHSVFAGFLLLGSARRGIVVFFYDDVHVHICHHLAHHLAHVRHVRHRSVVTKAARMGHLGGILVVVEENFAG